MNTSVLAAFGDNVGRNVVPFVKLPPVDAYLVHAETYHLNAHIMALRGLIFADSKHRYQDGVPVVTSAVTELWMPEHRDLKYGPNFECDVLTSNTRYRIISWRNTHG